MGLGKLGDSWSTLNAANIPRSKPKSFRVCVLGRSNVGKSCFLNALIHPYSHFRTGKTPGVTRGVVGLHVALDARKTPHTLEIVDLPGFAFSIRKMNEQKEWGVLAEAVRDVSPQALWIWLVEAERDPAELDSQVLQWLNQRQFALVFHKADRVKRSARGACEKKWSAFLGASVSPPLWLSSMNGEGMENMVKWIRRYALDAIEDQNTLPPDSNDDQ